MSKVIVAGAGHGGLIAASKLAKAGFEVVLFEKNKREDLGHDWEDRFTFDLLLQLTENDKLPDGCWRYRGDCVFVSPSKRTRVEINYDHQNRHKLMWRKTLIGMILDYAEKCGVKFEFQTQVESPIVENNRVVGVVTSKGEQRADMVIDSLGFFSCIRTALPDEWQIEKQPKVGDAFYGYRAYFDKTQDVNPQYQHEVYLYHECEKGLSWFCTYEDYIDILIGRIFPISKQKVDEQLDLFRQSHPWLGEKQLHGGFGIIPVRRPLTLMVWDGYAACGDSAFMTTPMNGMGIDLSLQAGKLLADTIINATTSAFDKNNLWKYNQQFHALYGGETAKNEGLKNSLLKMPPEGVDFLFDNAIIQSSDLSGAGKNMNFKALLGKFVRGMRNPKYFFTLLGGLTRGSKMCKLYKHAPKEFDFAKIQKWNKKIESKMVIIQDK